jgi:hypothetical protein
MCSKIRCDEKSENFSKILASKRCLSRDGGVERIHWMGTSFEPKSLTPTHYQSDAGSTIHGVLPRERRQ